MEDKKNLDHFELRSEEVQEILTEVPHWMIRLGNLLILILALLLLFITWFVKYPDTVESNAVITTSIPPDMKYVQSNGKIEALLVKDNHKVKKQKPIAILENTANYEHIFMLKKILDTISVNSRSFHFPLDSIPILFLGDIEAPFALFENSYIQYRINKDLKPYSNEDLANQYSISELNSRLKNLLSQQDISTTELDFIRKDLERQEVLFDKGVISAQEYENKQLLFTQAKRYHKSFEASISQIHEKIRNAYLKSRGIEINQLREEISLLKSVIHNFNLLKKAIKEWERLYVLQSNINGKVSYSDYWNVNQTVNEGDLLFTVIPEHNTKFVGKLMTPIHNSGKIKVGQKVNIRLENYPETEYGLLQGKIQHISLIPDNEGFYYINVDFPKELITSYNKKIEFKYEMRGTAEIITEDLRLIERILNNFRRIIN